MTPAQDVHHIKSPFKGGEINYNLLLDYHNLESLCKDCHGEIHASQQGHRNPEEIIKALDELFADFDKMDNDDIELVVWDDKGNRRETTLRGLLDEHK